MALKDIFTMVKADRYTADGCEELNKAREADVEDRTYQIGEISQKTGLQKTANGWVKPKNGKQPGATNGDKWQKNTDYLGRERISMETPQGGKVSIYESDNPKQKNARFRVDTGSHYNEFNTMEEAKAFAEKHYGVKNDPKLAKEIANMNHFEEGKKSKPSSEERPSYEQAYLDAFKDEKLKSDVKAAIKKYGATGNNLRNALYKNDKELSDKLEKMQPDFANQFIAEMQRESKPAKQYGRGNKSGSKPAEQTPEEIREIGRAGREWRESQKRDVEERQKEVQKALAEQMKKEANSTEMKIRGMNKNQYIFNTMMERHIPKEKAEESWNQEVERVNRLRAEASDSAPRVLTGDTRIHVRKA